MISITVNGEERIMEEGSKVKDLLATLSLDSKSTVVQRNEDILAREDYGTVLIRHGDAFELVRFVGGG